jgi:hypothetical protein
VQAAGLPGLWLARHAIAIASACRQRLTCVALCIPLQGQRAARIEMLLAHEFHARKFMLPDKLSFRDRERLQRAAGGEDDEEAPAAGGAYLRAILLPCTLIYQSSAAHPSSPSLERSCTPSAIGRWLGFPFVWLGDLIS